MRTQARPRPRCGDRGAVTAEVAVVLPVVALALVAVLAVAVAGAAHLQALDGARAGARAAALGLGSEEVVAVATRVAGDGAAVTTSVADGWATVTVRRGVGGGAGVLGRLGVTARAVAAVE